MKHEIYKLLIIFHNQPKPDQAMPLYAGGFLPLMKKWMETLKEIKWPS